MIKKIAILFCLALPAVAAAHPVESLRIGKYYQGTLDKILTEIGRDKHIRFVYDSTFLSAFTTSVNNEEEKTVGGMLKMFRKAWSMQTFISDNGFIYVARDEAQLKALQASQTALQASQTTPQPTEGGLAGAQKSPQASSQAVVPPSGGTRGVLTGTIYDATNGERIPYATVLVQGTNRAVSSDANGYFVLSNLRSDTATLVVQYIGYQTQTVPVGAKNLSPLHINLSPQPQTIAEVFIVGRKDDKALQQSVGEHKMKMSPIALKVLPNIGEKDVMRGFQLMPGVSAANESSSGMYVRGGTPDQNLIVYDGFTVYYVDHLHGFYSAFNANAVKDVQLYKGGFEAKYGGRLSSVTEITGKDGNAKKPTVGGEINLLSVNAYAEIPIGKKFTSLFAFRRSYQGYLYEKISGNTGGSSAVGGGEVVSTTARRGMEMEIPESYFYDMNAKLTYHPTEDDIVSLSFFNGTDYADNTPQFSFPGGGRGGFGGGMGGGTMPSISMENNDYERYGNIGASLRHARKWSDRLTSSTIISFSNFYSARDQTRTITRNDTTTRSGNLEDNNLLDFSLKSDWRYALNDWNVLEAGAFATRYDIRYSYSQSADTVLLDKANRAMLGGLFVQDKMKFFNNALTLTPGLRLSYFSLTKKFYAEPRLAAVYQLPRHFTLNAATGLYYQYANRVVREDVMSGNTDFWILSNGADIPVSSSRHLNLGLNYDLPNYLFSAEGYYKRNYDLSEYTLRFDRTRGGFGGGMGGGRPFGGSDASTTAVEQFFTGDGYSIGLELLAQKKAGAFSGWLSYTLSQVKNRFPDQSDKYFYASQDVTHEFKAVGIYKWGDFDFSASFIYATGRPYTAPLGAYEIVGLSGGAMDFYAVSDKNTFRLPDYIRLDLAASWRFDHFWSTGKPNAISISLFNALNRHNVSAKQFQVLDGAILESNINYLGLTPNVSVIFKF